MSDRTEPIWVHEKVILALHDEQIAEHGGGSGMRDLGILESALARPVHQFIYESADLPDLAAAYAYGIARNHPFVDGNKRMAAVVMELFLLLNGVAITANDGEIVVTFQALAGGELSEEDLTTWIRDHSKTV